MRACFKIFSWHQDFIAPLAEFLLGIENPGRTVVVFPHSRPAKFLQKKIVEMKNGPLIMPRFMNIQELFSLLAAELPETDKIKACQLDSVYLLYQAVNNVFGNKDFPKEKLNFPLASLDLFMPWGVRLAALMEDFFTARVSPRNFPHLGSEVAPFARMLLEGISDIHARYLELLAENGLQTAAQNAALVAEQCVKAMGGGLTEPAFSFCRGKQIIFAGFNLLSGVEEPLLRHLWEIGNAEVCLHTDPTVIDNPGSTHWAAREHLKWMKSWKAGAEAYSSAEPPNMENTPPSLHIYEGFDLHSQLIKMSAEIDSLESEEGAAIVLPSSDLLLPVLHSLSTKNINISMGYPLGRSPLAALLRSVVEMQEAAVEISYEKTERKALRYHWKSVLKLLHQPYLRMLGEARNLPLREIFSELEAIILTGERYISLAELSAFLTQAVSAKMPAQQQLTLLPAPTDGQSPAALEESRALLQQAFEFLIGRWENLSNVADLSALLMEICDFLITEGGELWQRFPLDGEYLFRLKHSVVPELSQSLPAKTGLQADKASLFSILATVLETERVPFEAYPLEGVQILGMLESRLLSFKNLFILDATEDVLPGLSADDPLLPDSLRKETGLPALYEREKVMAHTFYRLVSSSRNISLFYQTGAGKIGLLDDKKSRSRFIEELLWELEKERKELISHNQPPLFSITLPLSSRQAVARTVARSPQINRAVEAWMGRGISPSSLDIYLKCPLRFFYEKIAELKPRDETPEGNDPAAVGVLVHKVLEDFLAPYIGQRIETGFPYPEPRLRLEKNFREHLEASKLPQILPHDYLFMLKEAGPKHLTDYLDNMPETEIISLEKEFRTGISISGMQYQLRGQVDRTDRREGKIIVLDYKTGKIQAPAINFWAEDNPLWFRMEHWQPEDKDLLADLHNELKSLQLPVYLFAFSRELGVQAKDAAFVALYEKGKEYCLLPKLNAEEREYAIHKQIPALIGFVLAHLQKSDSFSPQPGDYCAFCQWAGLCGQNQTKTFTPR